MTTGEGQAAGRSAVEANIEYHRPEGVDLLAARLRPRFCTGMVHDVIRADFTLAATSLAAPAGVTALDCLTGNGQYTEHLLAAGFTRVIGVDLSEGEIAKARARFAGEPRAEFVVQEIGEFLTAAPGPYDFIFLGSLHHIEDYMALVRRAVACLRPGGMVYMIESPRLGRLGRLAIKVDEHLHTLRSSPGLWLSRVLARLGVRASRASRAWSGARQAEVHAHAGLDEEEIVAQLRAAGCDIVRHERDLLCATWATWRLLSPIGFRNAFRLLARKREAFPDAAGGTGDGKITLVVKARNEERNIVACLSSYRGFADEMLVVDDGSSDRTADLARAHGARVIAGAGKRTTAQVDELDAIGFREVRAGWIFRSDADERLTPTLAAKLREAQRDGRHVAVCFARQQFLFGGWLRHGGWFESNQTRFFRADAWDRGWACAPHTQPAMNGPVLRLPAREAWATLHFDYDTINQFISRTFTRYADMEVEAALARGDVFHPARLFWRPARRFLIALVVKAGWRDGVRGVIAATLLAIYEFLIEAKLWEARRAPPAGSRGRET
ncbi:MAG: methyltransferase domain-containing protein [Planctomycetes bacterium]|nr:methyltransferase domain-containing protein [Planctomycetota bacterium]